MITIIGHNNNSGLTKDIFIITDILSKICKVEFRDTSNKLEPLSNDNEICIFLESVDRRYYGKYNILIPNQEWFFRKWINELRNFQTIFVKTKIAYQLFSNVHNNVHYIGFTSFDMYKDVEKVKECFHTQGNSVDKGTEILTDWNISMPKLNIISKNEIIKPNVNFIGNKLNDSEFIDTANRNLIHICPSTVEGWGHYINEAKSMANVVVTTNARPMSELITDSRFLCEVVDAEMKLNSLGKWTRTNIKKIESVLSNIIDLDLIEIGKQNRIEFLENDKEFKERFANSIKTI